MRSSAKQKKEGTSVVWNKKEQACILVRKDNPAMQSSNAIIFEMFGPPKQPDCSPDIDFAELAKRSLLSSPKLTSSTPSAPAEVETATSHANDTPTTHYTCAVGEGMESTSAHPTGRYKVVRALGSGVYGRVLECTDAEHIETKVAIKAVRSERIYRLCAEREILALERVGDHPNICRMLRSFDHHGHLCIVQELIAGGTVHDRVKKVGGYSLYATQRIANQLLSGLAHIHEKGILHTDIKTDNIMIDDLNEDGSPLVKIVDLGSAIAETEHHPDLIGTQEYRAPEAMLQAGWSTPADVWALGCSLFEVFVGRRLVECEHEITHLHLLQHLLRSRIPASLLQRAAARRPGSTLTAGAKPSACSLAPLPQSEVDTVVNARALRQDVANDGLLSLLEAMLCLDPDERPSARELLQHDFFRVELEGKILGATEEAEEKEEDGKQGVSSCLWRVSSSAGLSACSTTDGRDGDGLGEEREDWRTPPTVYEEWYARPWVDVVRQTVAAS